MALPMPQNAYFASDEFLELGRVPPHALRAKDSMGYLGYESDQPNSPPPYPTHTLKPKDSRAGILNEWNQPASPRGLKAVGLDWDGPNDPDNPRNWPAWKKIFHSAIPAVYSFGLSTGISTFVAGVPLVMLQFHVVREVALLPVVLYTVGFTLGPLFCSPFSELYGRRWIYRTNFPMLIIFNAIAAASDKFSVLVIFRFLAGVGGSGVLAVGAGTISDLWDPKDAGRVGLSYILAPFLGPTLGPLIGAYVIAEYDNDWKYAVWVAMMILAPVGIAIIFMQETSKSRILYLRAKRRGSRVHEETKGAMARKLGKGLLKPLHMCVFEPLAFFLSLYTAYNFAMIFSFFGSYQYVYTNVYGFTQKQVGLCYIAVVVGFLLAIVTFGFFDATKYRKEMIRTNGKVAPEHRLYSALFGCWLIPIGLFWYAWVPRQSIHWIVPVLAGIPFGWGTLASFLSCMSYIVDTYLVTNSASAVAANGVIRFALGAAFPLFILQVYENVGIHWAGSIFAFISVAMIPVPWFFYWKGKELRRRSHYETCDY